MDNTIKKFIGENTEKLLSTMSSYAQRVDKQFEKVDEQFKELREEINERFDTVDASLGKK